MEQTGQAVVGVASDDVYVTLEQASRRFGVSRGTLWNWWKQRGLKKSKVGKCTFFRVADIRAVIERGFPQEGR